MAGQVIDPVVILDHTVLGQSLLVSEAALRNEQRQAIAVPEKSADALQAHVIDLPAPESGFEVLVLHDLEHAGIGLGKKISHDVPHSVLVI